MSITINQKNSPTSPSYYHCFKLSESKYVLFDSKMDMPLTIGSLTVIKSIKLPKDSLVFLYKFHPDLFFERVVENTIEIFGNNEKIKPPLRYNYIDQNSICYHHFKLKNTVSSLYDNKFDRPISYGSNQKLQATINKINKNASIFYYKEDMSVKNSFKLFRIYQGKK